MHYVFYNNMATQEDITKVLNEVKSRLATGRMTATDMVNGLSAAKGQPNATELTSTPAYTPPKTDTTYTSSNTASSLLDQQIKNLEAQQKQASDFMSANGGSGSNSYEQLINMQSNAPTVNVAGYADQLKTQYGTTDLLNKLKEQNVKVASIQGDIQKLGTAELAEIDTAEGRVASRGAIEGEKETIARKYNIAKAYKNAELYAEAAVAQAYQGNLTEANNMINQAVEYYTYDKKAEIDRFDKLFTVASDWVKSLTNQEQNLLTAKREELVRQNEETKADKKGVLELSLQYPSAGISITDSVEQATEKASRVAAQQEAIAQKAQAQTEALDLQLKQLQIAKARQDLNTGETPITEVTQESTQKSLNQISLAEQAIKNAEKLSYASGSGSSWVTGIKRSLFGAQAVDNLKAETNTLRTTILTMATDPMIKKFFGPQMSDADVELMTSAGTSLNTELQSPEQLKEELVRVKDFIVRAKQSIIDGQQNATTTYLDGVDSIFSQGNNPYAQSGY
jgi:dsDNA-binding SOS-regulon protein